MDAADPPRGKDDPGACWTCSGTGFCIVCGGDGHYLARDRQSIVVCKECAGSGACVECDGTGRILPEPEDD